MMSQRRWRTSQLEGPADAGVVELDKWRLLFVGFIAALSKRPLIASPAARRLARDDMAEGLMHALLSASRSPSRTVSEAERVPMVSTIRTVASRVATLLSFDRS